MPAVQRQGDADSGGGVAQGGVGSVRVNNQPVVVDGTGVSGHGKGPHGGPVTAGGVSSVRAGGIPINVDGNADTCGHARSGGSPNVNAG